MLISSEGPDSDDVVMQDAAEIVLAAHDPPAASLPTAASSNSGRQSQPASTVAPSVELPVVPAEPSGELAAGPLSELQMGGFQSRKDALTWLNGEGYAKSKGALLPLGVTDSSTVALLQPHHIKSLPGLKQVVRSKMVRILANVISDVDRLQMVFRQHQSWLEEHLGMEVAGTYICQ